MSQFFLHSNVYGCAAVAFFCWCSLHHSAVSRFKAAQSQAKKETAYVESYRMLATIRENFDSLSALIKSKARLETERADFQTKIQQLQSRGVDQNMEQVLMDLQQVKAENSTLEKELKKAAKKSKKSKEKKSKSED